MSQFQIKQHLFILHNIKPVITYAMETSIITKNDLKILEPKIMRTTQGPETLQEVEQ